MRASLNLKMKFKNSIKILAFHVVFFIIGTTFFIFLFHTPLFRNIEILFYRGIILLLISCTMMAILLLLFKKRVPGRIWTYRDIILSLVLIFSLNLVFFTHLPVTADRSISVFMLGYLNNNSDRSLTGQEITDFFTNKYLYEYGAMNKRLNEQVESGNVVQIENGYKISKRGQLIMKIYSFIVRLFAIDNKIVSP